MVALDALFRTKEQEYGLPEGYLYRTAQIESSLNPSAKNPNSSAGGLFQFINSTARQYGLQDRFDPMQATDAAARLARDNARALRGVLGRDPTGGELYLAHQQGSGGASKLLRDMSAPAASVVGRDAVRLNGGGAGISAGDFANKWINKFAAGSSKSGGAGLAINAAFPMTQTRASMAETGPKQSTAVGGLGGLGGWNPPPQDDGFDTGAIMRALGAALIAGDASVIPGLIQDSQNQRDRAYERRYDRARDEWVFGVQRQDRMEERDIARQDRLDARAERREDRQDNLDWRRQQYEYQIGQDRLANDRADRTLSLQEAAANRKEVGFRDATPEEAQARGSVAGQFGPDGRFYPINPPSGMTVESDGQGGIRVVQGPGAGGGGSKVPTNFEPDPQNPGGVRPISGGPGEQLPAEFAGRIGISDSFLGQAPALREKLLSGAVTGPWDRMQAGNNAASEQANIYRQLQSGADALQRLLTGAGMTENEAAVYAGRYLPSYTDDAASAVTKLDQMVREIENVRAASLRGRGGTSATVTPNGPTGNNDPLGLR